MTRRQCARCPWKTTTDPHEIPNGYCERKHAALSNTIATPAALPVGSLRLMACHETKRGKELPCVGWLAQQLGPGNNLGLRLAVMSGRISGDFELVGPQHERFEDTLPKTPKIHPQKNPSGASLASPPDDQPAAQPGALAALPAPKAALGDRKKRSLAQLALMRKNRGTPQGPTFREGKEPRELSAIERAQEIAEDRRMSAGWRKAGR